ncbi:MAG: lipid II flippase MurJ, partial [Gallionella sp.]|nr:lipid II flippase MurJ [Gallionella sp.]
MLLILLCWVKALRQPELRRNWLGLLFANLAGVGLVAAVRPYNLKLLLIAAAVICLFMLPSILAKRRAGAVRALAFFVCSAILLATSSKLIGDYAASASASDYASLARMGESYAAWQGDGTWQWRDNPLLPDSLERHIEVAARTRAGLIASGIAVNAQSMIDQDVTPQSTAEVITYLPRALQVAMLAPFPTSWFTQITPTRMVAVGETMINYLCFPGILLLLFYNRRPEVLLSVLFAGFFLVVNGFTLANVGTLYRVRYAYEFIMVLLGVLGWFTWLDKTGYLEWLQSLLKPPTPAIAPEGGGAEAGSSQRKETLSSGLLVMGLTLLCFLGFFMRDIMMSHTFGLGGSLDNFFIALLVPMFVVTVLCMPLGSVFVPLYLELKEREIPQAIRKWVGSIASWVTFGLLLIAVVIYLSSPTLLPLLYKHDVTPDMAQLTSLLGWALLIMVFSGMVILGNSVLNANGRPVMSSAAQLVVPVVAILALLMFGERYGVEVVMYGMLAGQLLNLLIIQYLVRRHDVSLLPTLDPHKPAELNSFWSQYSPMAATAFFVSVSALVSTLLAMSLPEGAVSAFNLGNKVVLFVTGLVGTAITAVVLPYFSSLVSKNHLVAARRELSLFLLFSTFISVPVSTFLYVWSQPIVSILFEGKNFDSGSTEMVARVMQYAVVQLPFFVCNSLLLKFATATKHVIAIFVVALIGLLVNIGASLLMMKHMGVAGIALGSTFSMVVSTILLVLILVRYWHITWTDAFVMLMNWMLFVTLLVGVHFASVPSICVIVLAYGVLLVGYFYALSDEKPMEY